MRRICNGEHRLLSPIRPVALTVCDIVSLAKQNKMVAFALAATAGLLFFGAHLAASQLEQHTFDLFYSVIKSYLSKKATGLVQQGVLHWILGNGAFYAFRLAALLALGAAYDLGRDVVFALGLLCAGTLVALLGLGAFNGNDAAWLGYWTSWLLVLAGILGWFWSRYMAPANSLHRSFDFDVGAALVRLRRF